MSVNMVGEMLQALFDVLECKTHLASLVIYTDIPFNPVLRYSRFAHNALHYDISKGNILIIELQEVPPSSKEGKLKDLCFAKHLLDPK